MVKILTLEALARVLGELYGYKIVLANGCFDLLTMAHVRHLQAARAMGDILCVTVTLDANVNKGPRRPIFPLADRCEMLAGLQCVDWVTPNTLGPGGAITLLRPNLYVKGADYRHAMTPELIIEQRAVEAIGGTLAFTDTLQFHSTQLLERLR